MSNPDRKTVVVGLRKIAAELRAKDSEVQKQKQEKCAHILVAMHGLNTLEALITGGQK
jgi:hypothetical protein